MALTGKIWPVRFVMWQMWMTLVLRGDGVFEHLGQIGHAGRRDGEFELLQDNAIAAFALLPGSDHARVILIGGDDFIARIELHAELHDLVGLAGVAGDGDFFGIDAEHLRQAAADGFDAGVEHVPHVIGRVHVLNFEIPDFGIHHRLGCGRDAAVVEVDHVAIDGERMAYIEPEIFVASDGVGGAAGHCICSILRLLIRNRFRAWQADPRKYQRNVYDP